MYLDTTQLVHSTATLISSVHIVLNVENVVFLGSSRRHEMMELHLVRN